MLLFPRCARLRSGRVYKHWVAARRSWVALIRLRRVVAGTYRGGDCSREPPSAAREFRSRFPKSHCDRVRAAEHAPRGPSRVLERIHLRPHGDRQAWPRRRCRVVTGAASSISRLSPALRDDTTVVARLRALRRRPRHGPHHHRSPRARLPTATAHLRSEASCALFDRFARRGRRGRDPQNPLAVLPCFLGNETALCYTRGNDSLRMAAARASSSFQTSRQQLSWLNSLFVDRVKSSVMEPI